MAKIINISPEQTVTGAVSQALNSSRSPYEAAAKLKINYKTLRLVRKVLILKERLDIAPQDLRIIETAIELINSTRQVAVATQLVDPVIKKYWRGRTSNGHSDQDRVRQLKNKQRLDKTLFIIRESCTNNEGISLPILSPEEKQEAEKILRESINALCKFLRTLNKGNGKGNGHDQE